MLTRADVERIIETVIKGLTLELRRSNFTDPNRRTIVLKLDGCEIDQVSFDVVQTGEYEG
jgi:hypothetical protein